MTRYARGGSRGVLEARFGNPKDERRPVLLLGHLDTVWPVGTLARMPWRVDDGWAYGPGVLDMKAGVVMALTAMKLVREVDTDRPVVLLLSGDEETGSHDSRELIEEVAKECRAVFVLEPAQGPQGAYKTARKGVGQFRLEIRGVPSHSGVDFGAGHSAVRELAWQIEQISALTDLDRGTTLNVGVVGGGTQSNVVAAEAWADIDLRVTTVAEAEVITRRLQALETRDAQCTLRLTGGLNRPPMERTEARRSCSLRRRRWRRNSDLTWKRRRRAAARMEILLLRSECRRSMGWERLALARMRRTNRSGSIPFPRVRRCLPR